MSEARSELEIDYRNFDYGDDIARWLVEDAWRITETEELIGAISQRLCDGGIPLYRLSFLRRDLHPELLGRAWFWRRGATDDERSRGAWGYGNLRLSR